jgi:tetratricopeptide (TPR) repeat protein
MMRFYDHTLRRDFKKAEVYLNESLNAGYTGIPPWPWNFRHYDIYYNYLLNETGRKNEALKGLKNSIELYEANMLKVSGWDLKVTRLKLAASYAILGENKKALDYLSQLEKYGFFEIPITLKFPGFDNLRNDQEFKSIVKRIEDKRIAIREKVREMERRGELHL